MNQLFYIYKHTIRLSTSSVFNFSLSANPATVDFVTICRLGVGFRGLNVPEAFLGNCELIYFFVSTV